MWSIAEIDNTVWISPACAKELFKVGRSEGAGWYELEEVTYEGKLTFSPDHMESMDYLGTSQPICEVLCRHKVHGDITFGSLEGDNAGQFWGYRFDGKGGMAPLEGKLQWEVLTPKPLEGDVYVITGALALGTRKVVAKLLTDRGAIVRDQLTPSITGLIVGNKPGSKLAAAKRHGVRILTEDDLHELLGLEA